LDELELDSELLDSELLELLDSELLELDSELLELLDSEFKLVKLTLLEPPTNSEDGDLNNDDILVDDGGDLNNDDILVDDGRLDLVFPSIMCNNELESYG
jgi:hypothetical protein